MIQRLNDFGWDVTSKMMNFKKQVYLLACAFSLMAGQAFAQVASPNVVITELDGQQVFQGDGGYDQIDYDGNSTEYTFIRNADLSVSVIKLNGVTDRLINIDGFWFAGEQQWYPIEDLEIPASSGQTIVGSSNTYNQVDYPGGSSDYRFEQNANISVSVTKPSGEVDTLINIEGLWFSGEFEWYPIGQLIEASNEDRTITGGAEYDQVDYPGASSDYIFIENANGSVRVSKPDGGTDTLISIDGFWFQGEEAWYPIESLIAQNGQTIVGTNGYDQVDYDGFRPDYIFVQNADGSVTVNRSGGAVDTLISIEGFWFREEEEWYSIENIFYEAITPVIDGVITGSNDVNDALTGDEGDNIFFVGRGSDQVRGLGGQDTLRVDGDVLEWTFSQNNGVTQMRHPTWGTNTLISIERIFSFRSGQSYTIDEAIASTAGLQEFRLDNDNVINGTPASDVIPGQAGVQGFYGGLGNDLYQGTDDFEQVNYDGARSEYTISLDPTGRIRVRHPIWGLDTLNNIDALIFTGVEPGVGGVRTAPFEYVNLGDILD